MHHDTTIQKVLLLTKRRFKVYIQSLFRLELLWILTIQRKFPTTQVNKYLPRMYCDVGINLVMSETKTMPLCSLASSGEAYKQNSLLKDESESWTKERRGWEWWGSFTGEAGRGNAKKMKCELKPDAEQQGIYSVLVRTDIKTILWRDL